MTEPLPPWARPRPDDVPVEREAVPVRVESAPEPEPEPEPESPPLFPTQATDGDPLLFPGGVSRLRDSRPRSFPASDVPRIVRRVRTEEPGRFGEAAALREPTGGLAPPPGRRPPPMPQQAAQAQDVPATATDPHVGVVIGPVEQTRSRRSYSGFVVLIVAAGLTVAPMLGRFLMGGVPFVLVIMPVVAVVGVWLARRLTRSGGELSAPGHRFRLQPADGRTVRVVIDGEIDPESLRPGDVARVRSAGSREGHIVAGSVDILATLGGPVVRQVTGRTPGPIVAARLLNAISIALAVLLVASAAAVIVG